MVAAHDCAALEMEAVPNQHHPTRWPQDSFEFGFCRGMIEPMKCLTHDNQISGGIWQSRRFGGTDDADESRVLLHQTLTRGPHLSIWFDAEDLVAMLQKELSHKSGS